ncbi:TPA: dTDP-4-dehydrorhamnose 3,5-epimerase [Citrobacter farmeri]|uniref:dTDP-4-dehydrorhamnose 3,5-epimerase n=1 Tax=Citrobacter farmeri TaxID=67824 RepID=UPI001A1ABF50|nr:dTDP-4-dehydrorhamnose 3,5-epimerase [Citrobacter farmeri]MBU5646949.1 dTDP-4-dehydrorhamnose 3,5-epimerase [Pluralibacter sp. S54_ASV_43]HAT3756516.1 dTDP-4-dehydrorhamnose 3,5-epimerase [Citrobacter amalonaticus]HAU5705939.1 dTDP-4-dehydrorhamnose 3,5-epimerase [Citrobacter freundii]QZE47708.1 dTDP-4-dehydrorhamnose 3,5-epimerase [Citrobacter farmeri]HCB1593902.1 dTDP-4-dehydrorhamnose 3,5-epimerase [Citrobacter farmeri]
MNVVRTDIPDVLILEPTVYGDERGFFYESFNQAVFDEITGNKVNFVQDNHSKSFKGVVRGLHYQLSPFSQAKLVRCIVGEVFDVAVDIRPQSLTFGRWVGVILSAENKKQLWIPEGFAHGFMVLSDLAEFAYKTNNYYSPTHEKCIRWDDKELNIMWPSDVGAYVISSKDQNGDSFECSKKYLA